jgi:hypothetical protein
VKLFWLIKYSYVFFSSGRVFIAALKLSVNVSASHLTDYDLNSRSPRSLKVSLAFLSSPTLKALRIAPTSGVRGVLATPDDGAWSFHK